MKLKARAKLNLALDIVGRLNNGYHAVDMLMQEISLHDDVEVDISDKLELICPPHCGPESGNTAMKAARIFFEHTGIAGGARITIVKNIPSQAGLGGGSSDGAAVLRALNSIYGANLGGGELCGLAFKIGADAPFFIQGGCARIQGVGEILTPVENNCDFHYLLVKPSGGVDTAQAYKLADSLPPSRADIGGAAKCLLGGDRAGYFAAAGNSLYPAAKELCPDVARVIAQAYEHGAAFSMMTGSGSCVFSIFEDEKDLLSAKASFEGAYPFVSVAQNAGAGE